nr:hypothetical protein B0A51_17465 [Rachicladosporium sp. CCFEE 5018]
MWTTRISTASAALFRCSAPRCRTVASTSIAVSSAATAPAPRDGPPKPALKGSRPTISSKATPRRPSPSSRLPIAPRKPAPAPPRTPAPTFLPPPQASSHPLIDQANILLGHQERLCLYKAPVQTGLILSSYFFGGTLFLYARNVLNFILVSSSALTIVTTIFGAACMAISAMATVIVATPFRLVQRIDIIRGPNGEPLLEYKARRMVPFIGDWVLGEKTLTASPKDVTINKSLDAISATWTSWPMSEARAWTYGNNGVRTTINFAGVQRAVAKMFTREGMLHLRVGNANWKIDLVKGFLLEDGRPLMKIITVDKDAKRSLYDYAAMALVARRKA